MNLVELDSVTRIFRNGTRTPVVALDNVSMSIVSDTAVAVIGESGAGKSTLLRVALGLERPDRGRVELMGLPLDKVNSRQIRSARRSIGYVFQDVLDSLDPTMKVGRVIAEPMEIHQGNLPRAERESRVAKALSSVGLDPSVADLDTRALSGGQQQRVGIARAMILEPSLVILDEPTASLDLPVRIQILNLLRDLRDRTGVAYLFVSHDFSSVQYLCDEVIVMHRGKVVERGGVEAVMAEPGHPHTRALVEAVLSPTARAET